MKEVKKITVKWNSGDITYKKNHPVLKIFEESSGCFVMQDAFSKNGGTSYDHPSLKKLIRVEKYNESAPQSTEVEKILKHRKFKTGKDPEILVKFKGYRIESWVPIRDCIGCIDLITEFLEKEDQEEEKEREEQENLRKNRIGNEQKE